MVKGAATRVATLWRGLLFVLLLLPATEARAHNEGQSYLYLQVYQDRVSGRFEIPLADFNAALRLTGTDREITANTLDQRIGFLQDYYLQHVTVSDAAGPLAIRFTSHSFLKARGGYARLSFDLDGLDGVPDVLTFDYSVLFDEVPGHRGFLLRGAQLGNRHLCQREPRLARLQPERAAAGLRPDVLRPPARVPRHRPPGSRAHPVRGRPRLLPVRAAAAGGAAPRA